MMAREDWYACNTTLLAYMGDSVYEMHVRKRLVEKCRKASGELHNEAVKYVCAEAQKKIVKKILDALTEKEASIVKRARNHRISWKPKSSSPSTYKWATGFEALVGYLYLSEEEARLSEILDMAFSVVESDRKPL